MAEQFGSWYREVCDHLQKSKQFEDLENLFNKQTTDKTCVQVLFKQSLLTHEIQENFCEKANYKSKDFRNNGNALYASKKLCEALLMYTKSIAYAESDSEELALAYGNRSAVLFELAKFDLCEQDILLSLENNYPEKLQFKLLERLGKCFFENKQFQKSIEAFQKSLQLLQKSDLNTEKKNNKARLLFEYINKYHESNDNVNNHRIINNSVYELERPYIEDGLKNKMFPCASESFGIEEQSGQGRCAVALKDIHAGEVIVVEKAFSSVCLPESFENHCYNCLTRFIAGYPCKNCAAVLYCSSTCKEKNWELFHKYECCYLNIIIKDEVGLGHLALKMVVMVGVTELRNFEKRKERKDLKDITGLNEDNIFQPNDYFCVYSLTGNSQLRKPSDLFRRTLLAIYLSKILVKSGFVISSEDNDVCLIATHLLKQIQMLPCNAHEVSELYMEGTEFAQADLQEIGSAAYTTLSLLNHSCDPSVVRHCYGDTCVLRAMKYIKKGDPIVDNYGFLYAVEEKSSRKQHLLDQYYFSCECIPCREDWPLYSNLNESPPAFVCANCYSILSGHVCGKCNFVDKELASFDKIQEKFQDCMNNVLETGHIYENLPILLKYLDLVSKKAKLPVIHLNNCQEIVKLCFSMQGNFVKL